MSEEPTNSEEREPTADEESPDAVEARDQSVAEQPVESGAGQDAPVNEAAIEQTAGGPVASNAPEAPRLDESAPQDGAAQDEIDAVMNAAAAEAEAMPPDGASEPADAGEEPVAGDPETETAVPAADTAGTPEPAPPEAMSPSPLPPDAAPFQGPEFGTDESAAELGNIDLLDDVELEVKIELGRTEMYIEDVLGLAPGSVVELDKAAGDPVDIFVNDRLVARGEVLVLNENFCVRVNDILSPIPELDKQT
jgi:flagellar motor switch protein FliN/FliY